MSTGQESQPRPDDAIRGLQQLPTFRPAILGRRHVVSSGHYLASQAGFRILERGGNAIDAGVAAGLALNVVQSELVNLGGVAPIVVYLAKTREVVTIAGVGTWPRTMSVAWFRDQGLDRIPRGILSTVVPAAADAWLATLQRYGTMRLADVAEPAIELAEDGFAVHRFLRNNLELYADRMKPFASTREIYFPGDRTPEVGDRFVQRDLGRTLRMLVEAEDGAKHLGRERAIAAARDRFYRGDIARAIVSFVREAGGHLSEEDMAAYAVEFTPSVATTYRGYEIHSCGPWSQGPVVLQALNVLGGFDLARLGQNSVESLHLIAEALKLAFADRHRYYGDPRQVDVPMAELLSEAYAARRRRLIDERKAWDRLPPAGDLSEAGRSSGSEEAIPTPDTSHVCAVDRDGNAFSCTPSDGAGDAQIVPGLGIIASYRGRQSSLDPALPSAVAPGRRPRLTPAPGLVVRGSGFVMPYGTPGGDVQPQAMVQFLVNFIDHGMDAQEAVEAPRLATFSHPDTWSPHPSHPGLVRGESRLGDVLDGLAERGHRVERWPAWTPGAGAVCAIAADRDRGFLSGAADFRRVAYAIGW